jgi:hypothetical protein
VRPRDEVWAVVSSAGVERLQVLPVMIIHRGAERVVVRPDPLQAGARLVVSPLAAAVDGLLVRSELQR